MMPLRRRHRPMANDPEEVVARALCHEDPDRETSRGPLWTLYRKEARRILAAMREAGLLIESTR
jgi:hypothetical protein